jgi:DNA-binding transcriptional LysR family regulator
MAHLPQARWIAGSAGVNQGKIAALRASDAETILSAVGSGLGRSLLPRIVADAAPRLHRLDPPQRAPEVTRELWLLGHAELRTLGRIEAVVKWIEKLMPH